MHLLYTNVTWRNAAIAEGDMTTTKQTSFRVQSDLLDRENSLMAAEAIELLRLTVSTPKVGLCVDAITYTEKTEGRINLITITSASTPL